MTRWKVEPSYPKPSSLVVARARKFSAVHEAVSSVIFSKRANGMQRLRQKVCVSSQELLQPASNRDILSGLERAELPEATPENSRLDGLHLGKATYLWHSLAV